MPDYVSKHGGDNINDAVTIVEDTIPNTAHIGNKLTTAQQVVDLADEKIWGDIYQQGDTLIIRGVYNSYIPDGDDGNLVIV